MTDTRQSVLCGAPVRKFLKETETVLGLFAIFLIIQGIYALCRKFRNQTKHGYFNACFLFLPTDGILYSKFTYATPSNSQNIPRPHILCFSGEETKAQLITYSPTVLLLDLSKYHNQLEGNSISVNLPLLN